MIQRRWQPWKATLSVASLFVTSVALTGCPKTPAATLSASAANPGTIGPSATSPRAGSGAVGETGGRSASLAGLASGTTLPALPSPGEFADIAALKDVHFLFDKAEVRPEEAKTLDADVRWLKANGKTLVLIEGHCDERGTNEYNLALGERRARATREYLVSHGIDGPRISTISYGEERPLCTEHTEGCWAKNRRAHLLVRP